jgi:hypothetical protein
MVTITLFSESMHLFFFTPPNKFFFCGIPPVSTVLVPTNFCFLTNPSVRIQNLHTKSFTRYFTLLYFTTHSRLVHEHTLSHQHHQHPTLSNHTRHHCLVIFGRTVKLGKFRPTHTHTHTHTHTCSFYHTITYTYTHTHTHD